MDEFAVREQVGTTDELEQAAHLKEWTFRSKLPIVGRLISGFREAWNSISTKWSVHFVVVQQSEFNRQVVHRLNSIEYAGIENDRAIVNLHRRVAEAHYTTLRVDELASALQSKLDERSDDVLRQCRGFQQDTLNRIAEFHERTREFQQNTLGRLAEAELRLSRLERRVPRQSDSLTASGDVSVPYGVLSSETPRDDGQLDYYLFELKFRGNPARVRDAQRQYIPLFEGCENVLDLGCGRGEFLELLRERGIHARGVDANPDMVDACRALDLDVTQSDVLSYLERLPDDSVGGVFSAQLVEHLPPAILSRLIDLSHRKLKVGAPIVLETPNPGCLLAMATHFTVDPSHTKPLHPETLRFLLTAAGFGPAEIVFSSPVPDELRLDRLDQQHDGQSSFLLTMNDNIEKLNSLLYGYQDYAITARKLFWPHREVGKAAGLRQVVVNGN